MIQRIQTLWFFLAAIFAALIFFFPVIELTSSNDVHVYEYASISIAGIDNLVQSGYIIVGLTGIIGLLSFVAIFLFKNRNLQMRISVFASLLVIFLVILLGYFSWSKIANPTATIGLSAILPLIIFIFLLMARRAVKKDDDLIKSVDRIR